VDVQRIGRRAVLGLGLAGLAVACGSPLGGMDLRGGDVKVHGSAEPRFAAVREAFTANFRAGDEVGAAVCVYLRGRPVVDLWAGLADPDRAAVWGRDTLQYVFSTTKAWTAGCAHLLAQRGQLDLDAPVVAYWPEFAAAGKDRIPVRWLLSHRAGLAILDAPVPLAQALRWDPMVAALAAQRPNWEPGTAHGYHAQTFGWLVGEVVRRVDGRTPGHFLAAEIAAPLGLDLHIGLPTAQQHRASRLIDPDPQRRASRLIDPDPQRRDDPEAARRAGAVTTPLLDGNDPAVQAAEVPSSNGMCTARALARFYAALIGEIAGVRVLDPTTLAAAVLPQADGPDLIRGGRTRFGSGFELPVGGASMLGTGSFGHGGRGGSIGCAHPGAGLAVGYVMNRLGSSGDRRFANIVHALRTSL